MSRASCLKRIRELSGSNKVIERYPYILDYGFSPRPGSGWGTDLSAGALTNGPSAVLHQDEPIGPNNAACSLAHSGLGNRHYRGKEVEHE